MGLATEFTGIAPEIKEKPPEMRGAVLKRSAIIAVVAFLTLIDLFGSQALLPTLVETYGVSPGAMGFAVNASTIGMALASFVIALFARRIDRAKGIWICLALLSLPTAGLALTDDLTTFTILRVVQGVFMATAFTLTLTYLSEICSLTAIGGAMAAYITGNVASNLFGRLLASGLADNLGLAESFFGFAVLNLVGAVIAYLYFGNRSELPEGEGAGSFIAVGFDHLSNPKLWAHLVIGFIMLFAFVATFTYANFVLSSETFALDQAAIGLVYFVFVPSILTTPLAARATRSFGPRRAYRIGVLAALIGFALLFTTWLPSFLLGLALVGAGLFFSQSVATASVGRSVTHDQAAANGLYLASYYFGGICGAFLIGQVFEMQGWTASVGVLTAMVAVAWLFARGMADSIREVSSPPPAPA